MTEIATLFQMGLSDSMIASRLEVSRYAVWRWRRGKRQPHPAICLKARGYLRLVHQWLQPVTNCNQPL